MNNIALSDVFENGNCTAN